MWWRLTMEFLPYVLSALGGAATVSLWLYATGKMTGAKDATVELRQDHVERRLDEGGRRLSDLTSKLMLIPGSLLTIQEELTRQRTQIDSIGHSIADIRVDVARLQERSRGAEPA